MSNTKQSAETCMGKLWIQRDGAHTNTYKCHPFSIHHPHLSQSQQKGEAVRSPLSGFAGSFAHQSLMSLALGPWLFHSFLRLVLGPFPDPAVTLAAYAFGYAVDDHEEHRNEENAHGSGKERSAHNTGTNGVLAVCASAGAYGEGHDAKQKAMEVMTMGLRRMVAASTAASTRLLPLSYKVFANSTMRMAFLADRPITAKMPTWK